MKHEWIITGLLCLSVSFMARDILLIRILADIGLFISIICGIWEYKTLKELQNIFPMKARTKQKPLTIEINKK